MNFFKKKKKAPNKKQLETMIDQKIKEFELLVCNIQERKKALTEEAKVKLKLGDKNSAKRILSKTKLLVISEKIRNETINKLEEQLIKLGMSDNYSDEDLNEFEQSYYSILNNLNEEIKNAKFTEDDDLSKFEGNNIDNNDMKFTEMESANYMKNKIIELEKRIIVLENKIQQLEGKNQTSKENNINNNDNNSEDENYLNEFLEQYKFIN